MNRVQGDYFETLLYKIFVSIDEHTTMTELSAVLQIDLEQVKVSHVIHVTGRCVLCHTLTLHTSHFTPHTSHLTLSTLHITPSPLHSHTLTLHTLTPHTHPPHPPQSAVSLFIRLGFAHKKYQPPQLASLHPSWGVRTPSPLSPAPPQATAALTLSAEVLYSDPESNGKGPSPSPGRSGDTGLGSGDLLIWVS